MVSTQSIDFIHTLFPLIVIVFVITMGVILLYAHFRKNLYKQMLEQEELESKHQNALLRASIDAQEAERKRIARDMHDELGATLSIARMHVVQLERTSDDKDLVEKLAQARTLMELSLASMRRFSHELMPPQLEAFGLIETLEEVCSQINHTNQVLLKLDFDDYCREMPWPISLGMYRVIMELVNNTLKHAHATEITLTINDQNGSYVFDYSDNGIGLPVESTSVGLGWRSMEARIRSLHGSYSVQKDHPGFRISIILPSIL